MLNYQRVCHKCPIQKDAMSRAVDGSPWVSTKAPNRKGSFRGRWWDSRCHRSLASQRSRLESFHEKTRWQSMSKSAQRDHWFVGHLPNTGKVSSSQTWHILRVAWYLPNFEHPFGSWKCGIPTNPIVDHPFFKIKKNDHFGFSNDHLFRHTPRWPISSIALPFDNHDNRKFSPMIFPWANHSKPSFFRGFPCLTPEVIPSCLRLRRPVVGAVLADAWRLPASRALRALRPLRAPRRMASRVSAAEKRGRLARAGNM